MEHEQQIPEESPTRRRPAIKPSRPASERVPPTATSLPTREVREAQPTMQYPPPLPPPPPAPESSGLYVPWWGFVLVILIVAGITCGLWYMVMVNRGEAGILGPSPTPIFVVITSTPTLGPPPEELTLTSPPPGGSTGGTGGGTVAPPSPASPTPTPAPSGQIQVGSTVMVSGTEGAGLLIRRGPGQSFEADYLGTEGELFVVEDGPREGDGLLWWYITDPLNSERAGWAAQDYLQLVEPSS